MICIRAALRWQLLPLYALLGVAGGLLTWVTS